MPKTPSYRQRKAHGQAIVTLTDSFTKKRRDYRLGEFSTPVSRERYHRVIAEWEALNQRLPDPDFDRPAAAATTNSPLATVEPLKRGRSAANETVKVTPASMDLINAARPFLNRQIRAIVDLQLLTGTRPGELVSMRAIDAPLFSPADADAEHRAAMHAKRKTPLSCDKASPPPTPLAKRDDETIAQWQARLTPKQQAKIKAWKKDHRFHPYQLRHTAATQIRREFSLEAAQLALGHASATITDAVYAERDAGKVIEVMRQVG